MARIFRPSYPRQRNITLKSNSALKRQLFSCLNWYLIKKSIEKCIYICSFDKFQPYVQDFWQLAIQARWSHSLILLSSKRKLIVYEFLNQKSEVFLTNMSLNSLLWIITSLRNLLYRQSGYTIIPLLPFEITNHWSILFIFNKLWPQ